MSSSAAESRTERLTTCSADLPPQPSPTGAFDTRPRLGFSPKRPVQEAGMRIDPPPSLACAAGTMPAATATAEPPEEPPGVRSRAHGLRVGPNAEGSVTGCRPNSGVLVLPKITRPAALYAATRALSATAGGTAAQSAEPPCVRTPSS